MSVVALSFSAMEITVSFCPKCWVKEIRESNRFQEYVISSNPVLEIEIQKRRYTS
jgi:hypothetical protein